MEVETGWRTGAVAITGASGQVGRALRQRLAQVPNRVVPLGRDWHPSDLADVEVVVHLAGTLRPRWPSTYEAANLGTVRGLAEVLPATSVRRVVFLSFVTADPRSPNPYLRTKGRAEQVLAATSVPTTILRASHVLGPPGAPGPTATAMLARRGRVTVLGDGNQVMAPVMLDDVAGALLHAALDPASPIGTFDLTGPEVLTVDEVVRRLNGDEVQVRHLPDGAARALALVLPSLPRPLVDVMLADAVSTQDPQVTAHLFATTLHPIDDAWDRQSASAPPGRP